MRIVLDLIHGLDLPRALECVAVAARHAQPVEVGAIGDDVACVIEPVPDERVWARGLLVADVRSQPAAVDAEDVDLDPRVPGGSA